MVLSHGTCFALRPVLNRLDIAEKCCACYCHVDYSILTWDNLFRKQVITRMDSIMFGVVGAWTAFYCQSFWLKFKTHFFIAGIIILVVQNLHIDFHVMNLKLYACEFSFLQTSIGVLFLLPFLSQVKSGKEK